MTQEEPNADALYYDVEKEQAAIRARMGVAAPGIGNVSTSVTLAEVPAAAAGVIDGGETAKVVITAQDRKGAVSLPDTAVVRVDTIGGVIWYDAAPWTSPLVVNDGVDDCIYYFEEDFWEGHFMALTAEGSLKYAPSGSFPSAGVAYCAATQHIVGGGLGFLALDRQLHVAWRQRALGPLQTAVRHWQQGNHAR